MGKEQIVKLRQEGKTYKQIRTITGYAKATISYHCKNANLSDCNKFKKPTSEQVVEMQMLHHKGISTKEIAKLFERDPRTILKWITVKRTKMSSEEKRQRQNIRLQDFRRNLKKTLVEYKGGCCEKCGYDKCVRALQFHHKNPNEKEFTISYVTNSLKRMMKEVDKCMLLCANCHAEVEDNIYSLKTQI